MLIILLLDFYNIYGSFEYCIKMKYLISIPQFDIQKVLESDPNFPNQYSLLKVYPNSILHFLIFMKSPCLQVGIFIYYSLGCVPLSQIGFMSAESFRHAGKNDYSLFSAIMVIHSYFDYIVYNGDISI